MWSWLFPSVQEKQDFRTLDSSQKALQEIVFALKYHRHLFNNKAKLPRWSNLNPQIMNKTSDWIHTSSQLKSLVFKVSKLGLHNALSQKQTITRWFNLIWKFNQSRVPNIFWRIHLFCCFEPCPVAELHPQQTKVALRGEKSAQF